ncbi:MAG TPA: hypothetical protein VD969_01730 [Symbiobacteriaceae bacterium]|nr:hypothetical protein [Symbiobacteriaceae bacterium]
MTPYRFCIEEFFDLLGSEDRRFLVFRENGAKCYPVLRKAAERIAPGHTLVIAMSDQVIVDYSFADEIVGKLISELSSGDLEDRYAVVEVSTLNQYENVEASFVMRKQFGLIRHVGGEWQLVGQRPKGDRSREELEETLEHLNIRGHLTAAELSDATGLAINACSNRLFRLNEARLAHRVKEVASREYLYFSLVSPDMINA